MGRMKKEQLQMSEVIELALVIRHINGMDTGRVHDIRTTFRLSTASKNLEGLIDTYNEAVSKVPDDTPPKERQAIVDDLQKEVVEVSMPVFKLSELDKIEVSSSNQPPHDTFVKFPGSFLKVFSPFVENDMEG